MFIASNAQAGIITFNDRTAFEAYISGDVIDNLSGWSPPQYRPNGMVRSGYSWSMASYICSDAGSCGDQSNQGLFYSPGNPFVYTYGGTAGLGAFNFDSTIYAFGLDFGTRYADISRTITLNGYESISTTTGGFLGIASTDNTGFQSISYARAAGQAAYFDNVTYATIANSSTVAVPEPTSISLLGLSALGFAVSRRKTKV